MAEDARGTFGGKVRKERVEGKGKVAEGRGGIPPIGEEEEMRGEMGRRKVRGA